MRPNLRLAHELGMSSRVDGLVTRTLEPLRIAQGWAPIKNVRRHARHLPFEFFPLIVTDSSVWYGSVVDSLGPFAGCLTRYGPEENCYLGSCGTSGIWFVIHALEYAKVMSPDESMSGSGRFLADLVRDFSDGSRDDVQALGERVWSYAQANPDVDVRQFPWLSEFAVAADPKNLDAAHAVMSERNARLAAGPQPLPEVDRLDLPELWTACKGIGWHSWDDGFTRRVVSRLVQGTPAAFADALRARH